MDAQPTDRRQPDEARDDDEQRQRKLAMKEGKGETRQKNPGDQRQGQQKRGKAVVASAAQGSALGRWASRGVGARDQERFSG
jgi:hypothetical protein